MAEAADALYTKLQHYHIEAATRVRDDSSLRDSMRNLAAGIDADARVSAAERSRLHGKLERIAHDVGSTQVRDAARAKDGDSSVSVFA